MQIGAQGIRFAGELPRAGRYPYTIKRPLCADLPGGGQPAHSGRLGVVLVRYLPTELATVKVAEDFRVAPVLVVTVAVIV